MAGERKLTTTTPSFSAAGDLTGVPAPQQGTGRSQFETKILVLGAEPTVDTNGFEARLRSALSQVVPGVTLVNARISRGAETSVQVPRVRGLPITPVTPMRAVRAWWLGVTGEIQSGSGFAVNGDAGFNRAMARAVAQSVTFLGYVEADYRVAIPRDGAPLDSQFRKGDACSGGFTSGAIYARACTRFAGATPTMTVPPTTQAAPPGGVQMPDASTTCAIRIQTKSFLRPTATFATRNAAGQSYPEIPAGTAVTVTGPKVGQQGALGLYPISVPGRGTGFAALDANDFLGCTLFAGPSGSSSSSSSITRPPSSTSTASPASRYPGIAALDVGGSSSMSPYYYGAVAFVAVLALGGAVVYARRARKREAAHARPKHNGRRRRARRRSRRARR